MPIQPFGNFSAIGVSNLASEFGVSGVASQFSVVGDFSLAGYFSIDL